MHDRQDDEQLTARLAALEQQLAGMEERLQWLESGRQAGGESVAAAQGGQSGAAEAPASPWQKPAPVPGLESSEKWLQRLGIGLLLFGLAFLFKYSIDQDWFTPWVRVGIGFAAAALLLGLSFPLAGSRLLLARTLAGGGIASLYVSLFAAFQLYDLLGFTAAFAGMLVTTAGAFALSLTRIGVPMAAVGAVGGYVTPFVLYTGNENIPALLGYAFLLTTGSLAVYLRHLWRPLVWITAGGAWLVMVAAYTASGLRAGMPEAGAVSALQLAVIGFWLLFALLPQRLLWWRADLPAESSLMITTPLFGFAFAEQLWSLSDQQWALVWALVAALYAAIAVVNLRRQPLLAWLHALMAALLLGVGLWHVLGDNLLLLSVAAESAVLLALAERLGEKRPRQLAHALFAVVLYAVMIRLFDHAGEGSPFVNAQAMTDIAVLGLAVAAAWLSGKTGRELYAAAVYVGWLALSYRELAALANGQAWVSAIWAVTGSVLLLAALRFARSDLRKIALGTLLLVAAKLFVVDLARIEAVWRVLISGGLGGLFLLLSYLLPGSVRSSSAESGGERAE